MVKILNRTNGRYPDSQVYWSYNGQVHSIAEQPYFDMPANTAGRMYFYLGSPTSQYNDFIEFTVGPAVFNGNTTRVDAFGAQAGDAAARPRRLRRRRSARTEATFAEDRAVTFQRFIDEVPAEFKHLAQIQAPYRIPSPGSCPQFRAGGAVRRTTSPAYASQSGCPRPPRTSSAAPARWPTTPAMCAALNRHVAHLPQSQWSNPASYYQAAPANYYSKFWHDRAINRLSYGFPYDDYAEQSSFISHGNPQWLLVAVGW